MPTKITFVIIVFFMIFHLAVLVAIVNFIDFIDYFSSDLEYLIDYLPYPEAPFRFIISI